MFGRVYTWLVVFVSAHGTIQVVAWNWRREISMKHGFLSLTSFTSNKMIANTREAILCVHKVGQP